MLKIKYSPNLKDNYYKSIANREMSNFKNRTFESYYNSYIKRHLKNYSLEDVLCGDFEKLKEIKNAVGTKYSSKTNIMKQFFNYDKKSSSFNAKTSYFQGKISEFFQENIEVHTCYYCNIDFINTFKKAKETKNAFTLDHVFEKATYPFLALSLYNLVPSCYTCNSKVKDSKIEFNDFSPTSESFDFNEKVKFKSFITNESLQVEEENDFFIKLIESYDNKYDKYIESLNLNNRYDYHKYKVLEMVNKRKKYPDSRIQELAVLTGQSEEEVKQDLFGVYLSEDLHKRPLSKLIQDISEELKLI
ncbi:hypothetical protein [Sulfurimonas sp. RIFOXYB12_FULL_35_9]|uniref:HNH endonuclease n=1 Tax=Sulfurimonas sp. RIFOXYB12_FULL_35_9 TaxID=1802256 RepID=UPI0008C0506B|nr:hypothetical protein [Sulfurimonas sp. RIFOXYB12_FULL_35_9]OHE04514.1 MAG: hypothetical protein A2345_02405 [Sulfurimonas sp. RIFOXYB12_FULL_35_9]